MSEAPQVTSERELWVGRPLWIDSPRITVPGKTRVSSSQYDVVVVGAGISGALVAHALARPGFSVLVIDKRRPIEGSSIASTAMIQHEIDVPLHRLQRMIGTGKANRAWQRSAKAVLQLEETVRSIGISCAMQRKSALFVAGGDIGARGLRTEVRARGSAGLAASFVSKQNLRAHYGIDREGAILSDVSASANPGQLTAGLLRRASANGAEIVSGMEVTDLKSFATSVVLATSEGNLLSAKHVVFCTGYEFLESVMSTKHRIASTWAFATEARTMLPRWTKSHVLWEGSDPYLYMRTDRKGRLIAGGEDEMDPEAFRCPKKLRAKTATIRAKIAALLGQEIKPAEYEWAAAFGTTTTGLPLIGPVPGMENVFAVMGFGGNGITFSQIAAEIITAKINGAEDPDADLFGFT